MKVDLLVITGPYHEPTQIVKKKKNTHHVHFSVGITDAVKCLNVKSTSSQ